MGRLVPLIWRVHMLGAGTQKEAKNQHDCY
jgi:hypothetical protein